MTKLRVGDFVRLLIGDWEGVPEGSIGKISEIRDHAPYPLMVDFGGGPHASLREDEVAVVRDVETQHLADQLSTPEDLPTGGPVKSPSYYVLPNGHEVIEFSQWLTGNGAQAVQYIARSTRLDGAVKGNQVEDLKKAILFLEAEIQRLESL